MIPDWTDRYYIGFDKLLVNGLSGATLALIRRLAEIIGLAVNTQNTLEDIVQSKYPYFLHLIEELVVRRHDGAIGQQVDIQQQISILADNIRQFSRRHGLAIVQGDGAVGRSKLGPPTLFLD